MERPTYRIKDWNQHFEKAQTRKCPKRITWIAVPNKHDGKGYRRIMAHERASDLYSAWILILQVASKCDPRGTLIDGDKPLDAEDLADATGFSADAFALAFDVLTEDRIGWLERIEPERGIPL